jgi:sugar phosphate isomerase/epimerase
VSSSISRRSFLAASAALAATPALTPGLLRAQALYPQRKLPFHLAVINDEIGPDLDNACHLVAVEFGLHWIELRSIDGKNLVDLNDQEIAAAKKILAKYSLKVSDIASPLFKVPLPGAKSEVGKVDQFGGATTYAKQAEVMEKCVHLAKSFGTDRVRCFDFERLSDPKPYLPEIREQLRKAAARMAKDNLILLLENEQSCNTATGAEAAATLAAVTDSNFMLNWDPGNAADMGEVPYPNGYALLPKNRIGHCHCKDVVRGPNGKPAWAPVGGGVVDWKGQIQALIDDGFHNTLSLETHWRGAGTPEASTRVSMAGLEKILGEVKA